MGSRGVNIDLGIIEIKAVTLKVPIGQIAMVIEKMNDNKPPPKPAMKLLSFSCEVAARRKLFECHGWASFSIWARFKFGPQTHARGGEIRRHCGLKLLYICLIHLYEQNCLTFWGQWWVLACAVALGFR